eukprot:scaffold271346_cov60-Attheya_sp.AAC.2
MDEVSAARVINKKRVLVYAHEMIVQQAEWATNMHRDTLASHVGHYDQLSYYAVAQNESIGRVRSQMLEKMIQPCGPPPANKETN